MNERQADGLSMDSRVDARDPRWRAGFWSLIVTQFQGGFNDNALKFLVIYLIVDRGLPAAQRDRFVLVVGALFALPFILFSMTGGFLADRFSKRSVTIGTKWMEVGAVVFSLVALARGNLLLEIVGVFLLSSQGALFGPSKYGLLPEILSEKDLSWGNGVLELGTFLASIGATVAAGFLAFYFRGQQEWSGIVLLACTLIGLATSYRITNVPAANPARRFNANPLGDLLTQVRLIRADRVLSWAVVGNTYLWFLAAMLQLTIVIYGHDILRIDERHISYLQAAVSLGIGLGCLATGYLSGGKIEYGLIPLGAVGMTVFGFLSAGQGLTLERAGLYLGLLGFAGGFYAVPLNALIQYRPDPSRKGGIIAAANLFSFVGIFLAAGVYYGLAEGLHLSADRIFLAGAFMTLAATFYCTVLLPDSLVRLALWALVHTLYRVRVEGRDNIPERGSALFVAGPMTMIDAMLLVASTDRSIRFLTAEAGPARQPTFLERLLRMDPVAALGNDALIAAAPSAFQNGEVVCLRGANLDASWDGGRIPGGRLEKMLRDAGAPVLAVSFDGAADGPLAEHAGGLRWKAPRRIPCRVSVRFGTPHSSATAPVAGRRLGTFDSAAEGHAAR
jgi:acyl-[acyl-carrier-protein]-phospholipid O-acyltransferase/long-chain-fatty-acid--[acyl-carrier-protein] ligase